MLGYRIVELPSRIVSGWCEQHNQILVQPIPALALAYRFLDRVTARDVEATKAEGSLRAVGSGDIS